MELQLLLTNASKTRRTTLNGRSYIVAPISLIVEGVLNGSKGRLHYPGDEIVRSTQAWNGMPITVYHPQANGLHVSARHPDIASTQQVGTVYNARTVRLKDGRRKLCAEGWFDKELTKRVDNRVYEALVTGRPLEVSTGLFTENIAEPGVFNGRNYDYIARSYVPDHLAVLPDQPGACSVSDGCGLNVNEAACASKIERNEAEEDGVEHECTCGGECKECQAKVAANANPEGCNQHTGPGCSGASSDLDLGTNPAARSASRNATVASARAHRANNPGAHTEAATEHAYAARKHERAGNTKMAEFHKSKANEHTSQVLKLRGKAVANQSLDSILNSGRYGNPQSSNTGRFKPHGSGTGKGECHDAAQAGHMTLDDNDWAMGSVAKAELEQTGRNPASWVFDEDVWERAKAAAGKTYHEDDEAYWPAVTHIYKRMGGTVKSPTNNQDAEVDAIIHNAFDDLPREAQKAAFASLSEGGTLFGRTQPRDFSKKQFKAAVESWSRKPLKEIRRAQRINERQTKKAYKETNVRALKNLRTMAEVYEQAATKKKSPTKNQQSVVVNQQGDRTGSPNINAKESHMALSEGKRAELIQWITVNCECWRGDDDAETLNEFSDSKLIEIAKAGDKTRKQEMALNAAAKPVRIGKKVVSFDATKGRYVVNSPKMMPGVAPEEQAAEGMTEEPEEEEGMEEGEEEGTEQAQKPVVGNARRAVSLAEWFLMAPPDAGADPEATWNSAVIGEKRKRAEIIKVLTEHLDGERRQFAVNQLGKKSMADLELDMLIKGPRTPQFTPQLPFGSEREPVANYDGAGGPPIYNNGPDDSEPIPIPNALESAIAYNRQQHRRKYRDQPMDLEEAS